MAAWWAESAHTYWAVLIVQRQGLVPYLSTQKQKCRLVSNIDLEVRRKAHIPHQPATTQAVRDALDPRRAVAKASDQGAGLVGPQAA